MSCNESDHIAFAHRLRVALITSHAPLDNVGLLFCCGLIRKSASDCETESRGLWRLSTLQAILIAIKCQRPQ